MFGFFRRPPKDTTAETAKDRLSILLAHERGGRASPDVLPMIQREIIEVIQRHMKVGKEAVDIRIERGDDFSTLEINIDLPGTGPAAPAAKPAKAASGAR
ncbi:cell division topological specificity factor MinE [Albimonas sp. CAU 1670]|uniref:cell division topological specificity factor MinE n=1 Tax=Albimonas sp. CAU 1670 TaxID=3032599 RepID=UPI0023DB1DD3|nr:cell division topological specificity factor MinE [Albimonas sp. CAU 1670]MDF2231477.1 cell division topological specificity factor MinE [Albimonas sp. CAU 1670]